MKYFNSILPFFIAIAIIFLLTSCGALPKTQQWIEGEFQYYKINEKDTILDYSTNQSLAIPVIASSVNHLHFYLTEINKHFDYTHRNWTEKRLRNLHKEYQSMNSVTFARVERLNDSFYLPSNSVNKVTCRYFTYDDELDKIILEFKRVLKPNGDLIIIQRVIEDEDYLKLVSNYPKPNPLPNKKSLINYFESKGFVLISNMPIVYNEQVVNPQSTKWKKVIELLIIFRKKVIEN